MKTECIVVDQSLSGFQGHHYEYTIAVAKALQAAGISAAIFANLNLNLPPAQTSQAISIWPVFHHKWTDRDKTLFRRQLAWMAMGQIFGFPPPASPTGSFGGDLKTGLQTYAQSAKEIFVHTLSFSQLLEIAVLVRQVQLPIDRVHLVLRQDPTEKGLGGLKVKILQQIVKLFDHQSAISVRFYADTPALVAVYEKILTRSFHLLPILLDQDSLQKIAVDQRSFKDSERLRVAYLGDARREKGYQHLAPIVQTVLEQAGAQKIEFLFQNHLDQHHGGDEELVQTQIKLRELSQSHPQTLRLIEGILSPEAYNLVLQQADVIVLPYGKEEYRFRSSGILSQAISAGKLAIVPTGTSLADPNFQTTVLAYEKTGEIPGLLLKILNDKTSLLGFAQQNQKRWCENHSDLTFVQALRENDKENKL